MDTHSPHPKKPQTVTKIIQAHFDNIEKGTFNPNAFSADLQEVPHDNVDYKKCVQTLMKLAKDKVTGVANTKIVTNLEKMTETLLDNFTVKKPGVCEVLFFPSVENEAKIVEHLKSAKKSIHVCMFTITNEHLCTALLEAYLRGVDVKILTDDEELRIMGSNVRDLSEEGIQVRTDASSRSLMHNKFSIIDDKILMTGSYNWTVRATKANQENVVIMDNAELVEIFGEEFNKLWDQFSAQTIKNMGGNQKKKTRLYQRYQDALAKLDKQKAKQELKKKLLKDDEEEEEITGIIVSSKKITKITKDTTQKKPRKLKAIPYGEPEESPESPPQKNFLKTLLPLVYLFALLIITRVLVGTWKGPGMEVESASRAFL